MHEREEECFLVMELSRMTGIRKWLCKETSSERGYTRQPERLDVWGMSCGDGVAEGERVERCRVHSMAEIAAREERAAEGDGDGEGAWAMQSGSDGKPRSRSITAYGLS